MPIPFLNSITLNKNEIQEFKVYNLTPDPTLTSAGDYGYMWLNTSDSPKTLKWWDGTSIRSIVDSGNTSTLTVGTANDLSGGVAGSLPYQQGVGDTTFLGIGTANQVLTVNSGATAPQWLSQSSLSVGSATTATTATTATNVAGGANGSILVQSGAGTTGQLAIGANGYILTSNGTTPGWSATIPSSSVSGLAASATTDTTNASNISSGTLGLARLALATGQFYVGDGSNNPAATAKSSIPLSGFGAAGADVAMGGFKITGLADPSAATDAATRGYVDSVAQGLDVKASCLVATTADITLASPGAVTIDGIYSATDFTAGTTRILVKDQSAAAENGIYIWQGPSSAMTRSADANTWDELVGAFAFVERGTANADSGWVCSVNAGGTLGTTAVTWVKFSQAGSYTQGRGMVLDGTAFNFAQNTNYTTNTIPYASGATTIGFIGAGTADQVLRVPGAGGTPAFGAIDLTKSAAVTGALPIANGGTGATSFTQGQVLFAGASTISSSANLFWDNANNRLGIGTTTPSYKLDVAGTINSTASTATGYNLVFRTSGITTGRAQTGLTNTSGDLYTGIEGSTAGQTLSGSAAYSAFIGTFTANPLYLVTNGSIRQTIDSSGNLGLGVTPSAWPSNYKAFQMGNGGTSFWGGVNFTEYNQNAYFDGTNYKYVNSFASSKYYQANGAHSWHTAAAGTAGATFTYTQAMTLDASGRLMVGTASARSNFFNSSVTTQLQVEGDGAASFVRNVNDVYGGVLVLGKIRGASIVQNNDRVSQISFQGSDGTEFVECANISAEIDGAPGANDMPGRLVFSTTSDGAAAPTERLRIKSTGQVNFTGLASDPAGAAGDVVYNSTSNRLKYHNGTAWVNTGTNKYSGALAGTGTSFTVTHNLGTRDVTVAVRKSGSTYDQVFTDVQMTDTNTVTIVFASSVTGSDYTVTVIG